jgi:hypothetical protein
MPTRAGDLERFGQLFQRRCNQFRACSEGIGPSTAERLWVGAVESVGLRAGRPSIMPSPMVTTANRSTVAAAPDSRAAQSPTYPVGRAPLSTYK